MTHRRFTCAHYCDGIRRRDFLAAGALTTLGLSLPDLWALEAQAAPAARQERAVIMLFMGGGASHLDTFDLKPEAPSEYRGQFRPIETRVSGMQFCDGLPLLAQQAHHLAVVRSVHHPQDEHQQAAHFMLTGWMPSTVVFGNEHPSIGSVVAQETALHVPAPYVVIKDPAVFVNRHHGAAFLNSAANPILVQAPFGARDVVPPPELSRALDMNDARVRRRRALAEGLDARLLRRTGGADPGLSAAGIYRDKALDLLTSANGLGAFDLTREPEKVRERYGYTLLGQGCLMARRLVEAGVRFITISRGGWDTHAHNFEAMDEELLPDLDRSFSALVGDLSQRGLLDSTVVIWNGEFGRTPQINKDAGRDHWPHVMTMVLAGGGIPGGQIVGASDDRAEYPRERPVRPEDIWATLYRMLGIDPNREYAVPESFEFRSVGRRAPILGSGAPLPELLPRNLKLV